VLRLDEACTLCVDEIYSHWDNHFQDKSGFLTVIATHKPTTDLDYLLHKSPFRVPLFEQVFGKVYVFKELSPR
jgi:hypothetical protein